MFTCELPEKTNFAERLGSVDKGITDFTHVFKNQNEGSSIKEISICKFDGTQHLKGTGISLCLHQKVSLTILEPKLDPNPLNFYPFKEFPEIKFIHRENILHVFSPDNNDLQKLFQIFNLAEKLELIIDPKFIRFLSIVFNTRIPEQEVFDEIFSLVEQKQFDLAIEKAKNAQHNEYYETIWVLADFLHKNKIVDVRILIDLYASITKNNSHYSDANERLVVLYTKDLFPHNLPFFFLEKKLSAAIESKNTILIDNTFHELCGYKGLNPKIQKLTENAENLIALASQIRALNNMLEQQKKQITEQKNTIESQKKAINASTTNGERNGPTFF